MKPNPVSQLRIESSRLLSDLAEIIQSVLEMSKIQSSDTREKVEEELQEKLDDVRASIGQIREKGKEARESLSSTIKEHPFMCVGGAFAVGYVLGNILGRK